MNIDDLQGRALQASDVAFTISDATAPDNPLIWVNPAFTALTGYAPEHVIGRNCRLLQGPGTDPRTSAELHDAVATGTTVATVVLNYRRDGTPFWNQVVISPVLGRDGTITHHVGVQADVTARVEAGLARDTALASERQATARLDLLARVTDEMVGHLDYAAAVVSLADIAVPALATWGYVAVTDDRGRFEHVHVVASDHAHAAAAADLESHGVEWLRKSPRMAEALASPPGFVPVPYAIDVASLPTRSTSTQLQALHELGLGSALVVPLRARDRVIGVMCLVHGEVDGFDSEAVVTAAHLGRRAGLALDNVRLFLAARDAALTLQHSLLPDIPDVPGLDISAAYIASTRLAEVGGDWFDVLHLPDGSVGLAVGDVVGHDMHAAAAMGQIRSLLRSTAWDCTEPADALARVDAMVRGIPIPDLATCAYVRWEAAEASASLTYARAGHPPPLIRLPGGEVRSLDDAVTTPLGIQDPHGPTTSGKVAIPAGATLVLYTDGLIERRDRGLRDGIGALVATLSALPDDLDATTTRDALVDAMLVGDRQEDDVCVLVVRAHHASSSSRAVSGPSGPRSIRSSSR
ncbi:SpoIIE family protein phosphatase [Cellulomonas rhizosphaerae]|uniref:PAS domain-containing protein n=1 Tax=Cellulomonas rhizosphaerae TaxID=2293719 RepID=A0A413RKK0_9CELL|nr:SpoIIE family protein phosphatase [Cellulomonas rhizosphaerae]RHA39637.1 PAS domain-containing protein [Cellulomonas rhizosphaerae]